MRFIYLFILFADKRNIHVFHMHVLVEAIQIPMSQPSAGDTNSYENIFFTL